MKMVSAAKLRRAQQAIVQLRPYSVKLSNMLQNVLSGLEGDADTVFNKEREVHNVAIVIVTSNRGLAGALNTNIGKAAVNLVQTTFAPQYQSGNVTFFPIGKKGNEYTQRYLPRAKYVTDYVDAFSDLSFDAISKIANRIMEDFTVNSFDEVHIVYSQFKNAGMQEATVEQFLPVKRVPVIERNAVRADYIFEPDKKVLLDTLIPTILHTQFLKTLLDTHASEHGARMTAMEKATDNANNLLTELKINYNKARQEAITRELSEIVGGAAALEG